jgi:hypothetical protein
MVGQLLLVVAISMACLQEPVESFASESKAVSTVEGHTGATEDSITWLISTEISIPMTGSLGITWGWPISERATMSNFLYYFDRDWMILLEKGDWHSNSLYTGLSFSCFPFAKPRQYQGYFVGGDFGLAISRQEFKPLGKSDIFFFPFVDIYFMGYALPIWRGLELVCLLGGGWAAVESQVVIDGHRNTGDYFPLVNVRLLYKK